MHKGKVKIQSWSDIPLIDRCAVQVKIKMTISTHGRLDWLCFIHAKLFEYVTSILHLDNESSLFGLLEESRVCLTNPKTIFNKEVPMSFISYS
jgi:hypothetical protein